MKDNTLGKRILLIHADKIAHYRVPIYQHFVSFFRENNMDFLVAAPDIQSKDLENNDFLFHTVKANILAWFQIIFSLRPDIVIVFAAIRHIFIIPFILILRVMGIRVIYWGHGINLQNKNAYRHMYHLVHKISDAVILYSEDLKKYIDKKYHHKVFVANNTLALGEIPPPMTEEKRKEIMEQYGIETPLNIIFVGRMQKRKRIFDLFEVANIIKRNDIGVILVGPDSEHILPETLPSGVIHIPALFGNDLKNLMMICDIYCCPGSVGLNIIDALACGLPFITEDIENHGPEIMYLKNGENGMLVPEGRTDLLAERIMMLLHDDELRRKMSESAKLTYKQDASIERMYDGFLRSAKYVLSSGKA